MEMIDSSQPKQVVLRFGGHHHFSVLTKPKVKICIVQELDLAIYKCISSFPIVLFMMKILFLYSSSLFHYSETGGIGRGMLIACNSSASLLDEKVIEVSSNNNSLKI